MPVKSLDPQVLTAVMTRSIEQLLSKMSGIASTKPPETKELEIDEYDGRMRVSGVEKFDASSYISVVNYYLSDKDLKSHKAKGAMILYIESENSSKLFKALGIKVTEDEDDV